ncbi:MAG: 2',3'-cyclic-nucleotide 2'-phosphodiesterase (5'-nucleotidase family) [Halobacteriales archaeon]|jgi:2',3'-cyclic-nucleotide 2'-phosphodiesterase (5'-nucleotidase family)
MGTRVLHYSDVENAYDDPVRIGRLAGLITSLRDPSTIVVGTGDNTSPGVLALVTEGRQSLDFFGAVEPDLEVFGNHDFDYGPDRILDIVRESPQTWLSANVRRNGGVFGTETGVRPWTVLERDGDRVGFLGLTDPATGSLNPNATGLEFTDPIRVARDAVSALRDRGVDHLVVLSHLGAADEDLAAALDVDVVLGGHVHSERIKRVDGTLLTRPGVNGEVVLEIDLDDNPTVSRHEVDDAPVHNGVADALRDRMSAADLDEVVGTVAEPIDRSEETVFRGESRVGNFVADAYRWMMGADVGLQNSGGIRSGEPLDGAVTLADLISIVPFEEPVAVAELTGTELLDTFRQADGSRVAFGESSWWHAHVSGARIVWDPESGALQGATVGGEPIDSAATYTVATTRYLFHSDHEFPAIDERHLVEAGPIQYESLVEFATTKGIDPSIEGRIVHEPRD